MRLLGTCSANVAVLAIALASAASPAHLLTRVQVRDVIDLVRPPAIPASFRRLRVSDRSVLAAAAFANALARIDLDEVFASGPRWLSLSLLALLLSNRASLVIPPDLRHRLKGGAKPAWPGRSAFHRAEILRSDFAAPAMHCVSLP